MQLDPMIEKFQAEKKFAYQQGQGEMPVAFREIAKKLKPEEKSAGEELREKTHEVSLSFFLKFLRGKTPTRYR